MQVSARGAGAGAGAGPQVIITIHHLSHTT